MYDVFLTKIMYANVEIINIKGAKKYTDEKSKSINHHFENQKSHINIIKGNTTNQKGKNHNQQPNLFHLSYTEPSHKNSLYFFSIISASFIFKYFIFSWSSSLSML